MEKKEKNNPHQTMDFPQDFRCPISMEIMKEPVTISTGFTYERKNIEKWFFTYKKTTCPTTMQVIHNFDTTPNHTLKRLILAWQNSLSQSSSSPLPSPKHDELVSLLNTIESTPFKVSSLKKLRSIVETDDEMHDHVKKSGGVELLVRIVIQILSETSDFIAFRASEEALGVLHHLLLSEEDETKTIQMLSKPESVKSMAIMLQRGSAEARFYAISIFQKMAKTDYNWSFVLKDQGMDLFKSMLELASDEICTKASSCSLQVLIEILSSSKKSRLKAIEAGAICVLIDLLPDSNRSKCEKIMQLIKLLCECAEGRLAFIEHGLGIAAVSKKMLHVSDVATKIGVKILWLICSFHHTERVVEEMLMFGAVKKLVALLHIGGRSSTKNKVVKILKLNVNSWRRYPCFPSELKKYLGLMNDSC
ncbi:E3 ubiquitin-protein ligase PUB23-like [Camellia sinensis]|uniref:U-box domain-containing protein n=1 Tax=Camellia sinensis var. sinensis TaxID=542762 RepID=A0A4S4DKX5_CAMSN|nr:E3 ubiquitin-protein ligase PUB23-like [Camellia sinensis]THG03568.1 hypothetical protein TEA_022945 [Camellia sinensis var. sinensis]